MKWGLLLDLLARKTMFTLVFASTLHLKSRSVMCNGAEEKQAHCCDPYGLRAQEQPLFLVCFSVTIFTSIGTLP